MITRSKQFKGTWLDRTGVSWEYRRGKGANRLGKRVVCHMWADTQTLEMRLVKGDGRTDDFIVYDEQEIKNGTEKDADRLATYWLDPNGAPTVIRVAR